MLKRTKFSVLKEVYGQWMVHETSEMFEDVVEAARELSGNFWIVTELEGWRMTTEPPWNSRAVDLRFSVDVPPQVAFQMDDGTAFFPRGKGTVEIPKLLTAEFYNKKHLPVWGAVEAGTAYSYARVEFIAFSYIKGIDLLAEYKKYLEE